MGGAVLEQVLQTLRKAGFAADLAYPGRKYPLITGTVAAVHLEKVDALKLETTVKVEILCPGTFGGTACELEALRALEALHGAGAACVQESCRYHTAAQVYITPVHATFLSAAEPEDTVLGPGFQVLIAGKTLPYATAFTALIESDHKTVYSVGMRIPATSTPGPIHYSLRLKEMIPIGSELEESEEGTFSIRVVTEQGGEVYHDCRWTSIQRDYTKEGLRQIRKGFGRVREAVSNG